MTTHITVSKLSKLQRKILRLALKGGPDRQVDLFTHEALEGCFGFPPRELNKRFISTEVGPHYKSAYASVSRAFSRLAERGLVEQWCSQLRGWTGIRLTEKGRRIAEKLSPGD